LGYRTPTSISLPTPSVLPDQVVQYEHPRQRHPTVGVHSIQLPRPKSLKLPSLAPRQGSYLNASISTISAFQCGECPKRFTNRFELNHHSREHQRTHICSSCSRAFTLKKDLTRHTESCQKRDPAFFCEHRDCGRSIKGFQRRDNLRRHMRIQHQRDEVRQRGIVENGYSVVHDG